jgi:hypothetical protein
LIVRVLKGLEVVIPNAVVHATWRPAAPNDEFDEHMGWVFGNPEGTSFMMDSDPEPIFNSYSVSARSTNMLEKQTASTQCQFCGTKC